jgi:polar amino acid transport system permease protein
MDVFGELLAPKYLAWLGRGFLMTVWLSLCVCVVASALGFLLCMARVQGRGLLGWGSRAYLSVFRNTPLLVQLFFWYFGVAALIPQAAMAWLNTPHQWALGGGLSIGWPPFEFIAGFWGLVLYTTAFIAEEFRAGVQGVPAGQHLAAQALGFTRWQLWRCIIMPQALRNALSPLAGQYMNTVKNTSLAMAIGLAELSYASRQVETETFKTFQAFGIATVLYVLVIVVIELAAQAVQRRFRSS